VVAAHELFHAVQWNTPYYKQGRPSDYIIEGTAEAIGYDLASRFLDLKFQDDRSAGLRPYSKYLAVHGRGDDGIPDTNAYKTSSFWRYLGELNLSRKPRTSSPDPGVVFKGADYSYLARLFNRTAPGRTFADEFKWLDKGLAEDPWISSNFVYIWPMFTTLAAEMSRERHYERNAEKWRTAFFGECKQAALKPSNLKSDIILRLDAISAQCFEVSAQAATSEVDVVIQIEAQNQKEIDQIWLGTGAGERIARRQHAASNSDRNEFVSVWTLRVKSGSTTPVIVSNIHQRPDETVRAEIKVSVTLPFVEIDSSIPGSGDFLEYGPPAPNVSPKPSGPSDREKTARRRAEQAAARITLEGPAASRIAIDPDQRFLRITLGASPDIANFMGGINGSGGFLDQLILTGEGLSASINEIPSTIARERDQLDTTVSITIPYVDYGFAGTLQGADIAMSGGEKGRLEAVGPRDSVPGPQREFKPSGQVTITEYTPTLLTGSFTADMVRPASITQEQREQSQPTLKIEGQVKGRFVIAAPWQEDVRFEPAAPIDPFADLANDVSRRMPAELKGFANEMAAKAKDAAEMGEEPDFSSIMPANNPTLVSRPSNNDYIDRYPDLE